MNTQEQIEKAVEIIKANRRVVYSDDAWKLTLYDGDQQRTLYRGRLHNRARAENPDTGREVGIDKVYDIIARDHPVTKHEIAAAVREYETTKDPVTCLTALFDGFRRSMYKANIEGMQAARMLFNALRAIHIQGGVEYELTERPWVNKATDEITTDPEEAALWVMDRQVVVPKEGYVLRAYDSVNDRTEIEFLREKPVNLRDAALKALRLSACSRGSRRVYMGSYLKPERYDDGMRYEYRREFESKWEPILGYDPEYA